MSFYMSVSEYIEWQAVNSMTRSIVRDDEFLFLLFFPDCRDQTVKSEELALYVNTY